ncbi:MAG: amidohydrolase [Clostridium sp.]
MGLNNREMFVIEKLFVNCIIYSMNKSNSVYRVMGVSKGKIVFLGNSVEIINIIDKNTEIIDLGQKIIIPAFIDTHIKIPERIIMNKDNLSLYNCKNVKEYLKTINDYVSANGNKRIIYGAGWDYNKFLRSNNSCKSPNKQLLNNICNNKPIILRDNTGSVLWLNDTALEYFEIDENTITPVGGTIELDERGETTGILKGHAAYLINLKDIVDYNENDYFNGFIKFQDKLHSYGITSIGLVKDGMIDIPLELYKMLYGKNLLKIRIYYGIKILPYEICHRTIYEQIHELKRLKIIYENEYFDINRACFQVDGPIRTHEAFLFKPYKDKEKSGHEYLGRFMWNLLEFKEGLKMANRLDFNTSIEAKGDNACRLAIDGIEYSRRNNNYNKCRNSIVNLELVTKYYIRRMKNLKVNAIIHPFWYYQDINDVKREYELIGEERIQRLYPYRSLIENNILTSSSSDYYVEDNPDPIKAIWCSVTRNLYDFKNNDSMPRGLIINSKYRLNPSESVDVLSAVKSFTIDAAYILGKDNEIGSIEIGKNADFIVLSKDIFKIDPAELENTFVCRTYFQGNLLYKNQ